MRSLTVFYLFSLPHQLLRSESGFKKIFCCRLSVCLVEKNFNIPIGSQLWSGFKGYHALARPRQRLPPRPVRSKPF